MNGERSKHRSLRCGDSQEGGRYQGSQSTIHRVGLLEKLRTRRLVDGGIVVRIKARVLQAKVKI